MMMSIDEGSPTATYFLLGTGHLLMIPINVKLTDVDASFRVSLPLEICWNWTDHLNPEATLACDERLRGHVARIQQVHCRQDISLLHACVNAFGHRFIGDGVLAWWQRV